MKFNNKKGLRILGIFAIVLCLVMCLGITAFAAEENVAEVNGTEYPTLAEAIAAAQNGDVITLLADVTETVKIEKNITLNLNGKTLYGSILAPKAELTIMGGAIVNKDKSVSSLLPRVQLLTAMFTSS